MKLKSLEIYTSPFIIFWIFGKKMRPVLTLMSAEVLMPIIKALPAALAVEVFIIFH
jgi:geranylgeranyl pyrophosphate synthase